MQLDVTDDASVAASTETVGALDVLVNNAPRRAAAFPRMGINSVDPGFTATDFNDHRGTQTVEQGAEAIVRYARIAGDGPTGGFFDANGTEPW